MTTYHLEVYTSAPELLDAGGSNLGVIARTRDYPATLSRDLSNYRYYTFLDELPLDDPRVHPPRVVMGPAGGSEYYTITHSAFLGSDFTGRTTPTVHHAAIKPSEVVGSGYHLGDFLVSLHHAYDRFRFSEPTWIVPPPTLEHQRIADELQFRSAFFQALDRRDDVLCFIINSLIRYAATGRPVVLVLEPQMTRDPLLILADVFSVLPRSVQNAVACSTHNVDTADFVRGSAFGITYRDTEFYRQILNRHDPKRPYIVDPSNSSSFVVEGDGSFVALLRKALGEGTSKVTDLLTAYDGNGTSANGLTDFCRFWETREALKTIRSAKDVSIIDGMYARLVNRTAYADDALNAASLSFVGSTCDSVERDVLLSEVVKSEHWPRSSRIAAVSSLKSSLGKALPSMLSGTDGAEPSAATLAFLGEQLADADAPRHWLTVAKHFLSTGGLKGIALSRHILSKSPIPLKLLLTLRGKLSGIQSQAVDRLHADLNENLRGVLESDKALRAIDECATDPKCQQHLTHVMQVATLLQPAQVRSIAIQLIGGAIKSNLEPQVNELVRSVGRLGEKIIDAKTSQEMIRLATGTKFEKLVQSAFEREMTLQAPSPAPPRSEPRRVLDPEPMVETVSSRRPLRASGPFKLKPKQDLRSFTLDGVKVAGYAIVLAIVFGSLFYVKHKTFGQIISQSGFQIYAGGALGVGIVSLLSVFVASKMPDSSPLYNVVVQLIAALILALGTVLAVLTAVAWQGFHPIRSLDGILKLLLIGMI